MRITRLKLRHFAGLTAGLTRKEIDIDFTKSINPITLIVGKNGSGKTTLLSNLHPFPYVEAIDVRNSQDFILPGKDGLKHMEIVDGENTYTIDIHYLVQRDKRVTRCFIKKNGRELNSTGLVRSYYDILKLEFGIEPSFLRILRLGPNVSDIISMKSTDRKDYISTFLQDIDIYTKLYQVIKQESIYTRNQLKVLTANYNAISDMTELRAQEQTCKRELETANGQLTALNKELGQVEALYNQTVMDDDEVEAILTEYRLAQQVMDAYHFIDMDKYNGNLPKAYESISTRKLECENTINTLKSQSNELVNQSGRLSDKLTDYLNKRSLMASYDSSENISATINEYKSKIIDLNNPYKTIADIDTYNIINKLWSNITGMIHDNLDVNVLAFFKQEAHYFTEENILDGLDDIINQRMSILSEEIAATRMKVDISILKGQILFIPSDCKSHMKCPYYKLIHKLKVEADKSSTDALNESFDMYNHAKSVVSAYKMIQQMVNAINTLHTEIQVSFGELFNAVITFKTDYLNTVGGKIENLVSAAMDYNLYEQYNAKIAELEHQREMIKQMDGASIIQDEIDSLTEEINVIENRIVGLNGKSEKANKDLELITDEYLLTKADYDVYIAYTSKESYYLETKARFDAVTTMEANCRTLKSQMDSLNHSISVISGTITELDTRLKDIYFKVKTKSDLENQMDDLQKRFENTELIREALSSTKGIPLIFIQLYLKNIQILANAIIHEMFGDSISLLDFIITDKEFSMPYMVNGIEIADVSYSSQGERTTIVLALSFALLQQFMGRYNILLLDEVDSALYKDNRRKFIKILEDQMSRIGCEQAFLITHNALFENYPVDIIETSEVDTEFRNSNVIWSKNKGG